MQIPYIYAEVDGVPSLTLFLGGVPTPVDSTHPSFDEILENIETISPKEVRDLLDRSRYVKRQLARFGNVTVDNGVVTYKGEVVNGLLADRMIQMLNNGQDIRPWALFLENLKKNPAKHAVDELFGWLEKANMPITERGNFLAYKKVNDDYTSYHRNPDGTDFRNDIGTFVSMDRNKVDDNRNRTCSSGLHFCSWHYLPHYMGGRGKVVVLEINPAHVVSIPTDYNNAKGRAEGYLIVGEIPEDEARHAFPGLAYVGYDNSDYITYKQTDEVDYSSIDDGWWSGDYIDDEDINELVEDAYETGYNEGHAHGLEGDFYDAQLGEFDFDTEEELDAYYDGYDDGFYAGDRELSEDEQNTDDTEFEPDITFGVAVIELLEEEGVPNVKLPSPQSWTMEEVADAINAGLMTFYEFVKFYDPDAYTKDEILDRT